MQSTVAIHSSKSVDTIPTTISKRHIEIETSLGEMWNLMYKLGFPLRLSQHILSFTLLDKAFHRIYGCKVTHMMYGKAINLYEVKK